LDLTNPNNWFVVKQETVRANITAQGGSGIGSVIFFDPIPPISFSVGSPIVSLSVSIDDLSPNAKWVRAGWFSAFLNLPTGKNRVLNRKIYLFNSNIYHIPYYGVLPYQVEIALPKYFDHANYICSQFDVSKVDFVVTDPGLQLYLEGQDVTLNNITVQQRLDNGNYLYEFTEQVRFSKYQVRYYTGIDESILAQQPIFDTEPGLLKVRFYTRAPLGVNQVSVKIGV
jgi:hypothetical protein